MIKKLFCILILMMVALPALSKQVDKLYEVILPVSSQSNSELRKVTVQGLKTTLIRVSGSSSVIKQRPIQQALKGASSFIKQYGYDYLPAVDEEPEQMVAKIEFESQLIDKLLRDSGQPLWSANRPTVLLWMAVKDSDGRRFVSREKDADIVEAIEQSANRRGLALILPELDIQDMVAWSANDLWQLNLMKAKPALARYKADTVLLGRVTKLTNGEWLGRWLYSYDQQDLVFDSEALNVAEYFNVGLDQVAEILAEQYAVTPVDTSGEGLLMRITGVVNFVDYARVISYLESVAAIRHANVVNIENDTIIVRLIADGQISQLQQALALDSRLKPTSAGAALDPDKDTYLIDLHYYWPTSLSGQSARTAVGSN